MRRNNFVCDFFNVDLSLVQARQVIDTLTLLETEEVGSQGRITAILELADEWMSYRQFKR